MDARLSALNRFGLGTRPGERERVSDPRDWLRAQLAGGAPRLDAPPGASPGEIGDAVRGLRALGPGDDPGNGQSNTSGNTRDDNRSNEMQRRDARRRLIELGGAEVRAALAARITSERPFVERLVAFWSNHLCVSASARILVAPLAGSYERDVIRPHVFGRFSDMVLASAKHPAMLVYLDNFQSIGPGSHGARAGRRGRQRGLNENYARELLELHTLGVNGGYTQQDVQELARILTGWTVSGLGRGGGDASRRGRRGAGAPAPGTPIAFHFEPRAHEPGSKTVLGQRYAEGGVEEGERVIRALCRHPSTARFVATKLVTHFVADDPPPAAVERVSKAFRDSDGDLGVVSHALIDAPEAWHDDARKFRTPQDWFVAVMRAFGAREVRPNTPVVLRQLRQPFWSPPSPKGFSDAMQDWSDPDALLNRAELSRSISRVPAVAALDARALLDVMSVPNDRSARAMLSDPTIPAPERIALAIAGPAFQWR